MGSQNCWELEIQKEHAKRRCHFCSPLLALGSTPTSGRAVQQKVEGRFNHGMNFFDWCHPQRWESIAFVGRSSCVKERPCSEHFHLFDSNHVQRYTVAYLRCYLLIRDPWTCWWCLYTGTLLGFLLLALFWNWELCKSLSLVAPASKLVLLWETSRASSSIAYTLVLPFFNHLQWRGTRNMLCPSCCRMKKTWPALWWTASVFCACRQQRATATQCSRTTWPHSFWALTCTANVRGYTRWTFRFWWRILQRNIPGRLRWICLYHLFRLWQVTVLAATVNASAARGSHMEVGQGQTLLSLFDMSDTLV